VAIDPLKARATLIVDGHEIVGWQSYEITVSLTEPGTFKLQMPFSREAWDLCRPDRPVRVAIEGTPILTGFIDDSPSTEDGDTLEVTGRDKVGRLVQESAPGINFGGQCAS
jgi:prophage tail gpP-like protein